MPSQRSWMEAVRSLAMVTGSQGNKGLAVFSTADGVVLAQRETGSHGPRAGCETRETINSAFEKVPEEACLMARVVAG